MKKYIGVPLAILVLAGGLFLLGKGSREPQAFDLTMLKAHGAAVDYFLKIDGIAGESTDEGHRGEIELESWSWGETQSGTRATGGGGGAGKVSMQDFHFTMKTSKASPILMQAVADGRHFPKAEIAFRKAGAEPPEDYMTITMENVLVTSYQISGSGGGLPLDSMSLNFTKITYKYCPQQATGASEPCIEEGWNVQANKPI